MGRVDSRYLPSRPNAAKPCHPVHPGSDRRRSGDDPGPKYHVNGVTRPQMPQS